MKTPGTRWQKIVLAVALLGAILGSQPACADDDYRRALVGVRLFTAFLAADRDLADKARGAELPVALVYRENPHHAREVAERLRDIGAVRGIPLRVDLVDEHQLEAADRPPPAGLFLIERIPDLAPILEFADRHRVLVFSPYRGDVERGVHGGLYVTDRILPFVNTRSLQLAGIRLKSFFLEVAKIHGAP